MDLVEGANGNPKAEEEAEEALQKRKEELQRLL